MSKIKKTLNSSEALKVFVGMSGGVDSSVSAALLQEQGYDVTGVFIKVWQPDFMPCSWKEERREAMRVCAHLNIPFITLDLEKEYKKEVVDYMIDEYKKGKTPNPDVMCNRYVKFGGFFDYAMKEGADFVATGHYACIKKVSGEKGNDTYQLLAGEDHNKDQSYFLWTLTQRELSKTLFPVGDIEKPEVRKLAQKFLLPNALKKDSQGLCFVGKIDMKEFLTHFIEQVPGNVIDEDGNIIGTHTGALFYTLGERHGFVIDKKTPDDNPYFVISKNIEENTLTVAHEKHQQKHQPGQVPNEDHSDNSETMSLKNVNWIEEIPTVQLKYKARIRYRGKIHEVVILPHTSSSTAEITFKDFDDIAAAGQSVVVYRDDICIGGGVIDK